MNQWNTAQRVRAASVTAESVVWWCGRSSGAGEVSQILAARKDGCRSEEGSANGVKGAKQNRRWRGGVEARKGGGRQEAGSCRGRAGGR